MAKLLPRIGSRKNGRISSRKNARKIPKGVIHVQASFNNTIVTVTDVRGRVISWSSAGACGFRATRADKAQGSLLGLSTPNGMLCPQKSRKLALSNGS